MLPDFNKKIILLFVFIVTIQLSVFVHADTSSKLRTDLGYSAEEFINRIERKLKLENREINLVKREPVQFGDGTKQYNYESKNKK